MLLTLGFGGFVFAWRRRRPRKQLALATAGAASLEPELADHADPVRHDRLDHLLRRGAADVLPAEASIPRWRRPSVQEARFSSVDPRQNVLREKLAFQAPPDPDVERLVVRYDLVSLLGSPDVGPAVAVADLRSGDEVDVISRRDGWIQARTPRGTVGWIPAAHAEAIGRKRLGVAVTAGGPGVSSAEAGFKPDAPGVGAASPKGGARSRRPASRAPSRPASRPSRSAGSS